MIRFRQFRGYGPLITQFWSEARRHNIPLIESMPSAAAFCKARQKLPPDELLRINKIAADFFYQEFGEDYKWKGHRVFMIDGSKMTLSSAPKIIKYFGRPNKQKNAPCAQAFVSALFDVFSKIPIDMSVVPNCASERNEAVKLFTRSLRAGDLIIFDRGYPAYWFINELKKKGIHFIIRTSLIASFGQIKKLALSGKSDEMITLNPPSGEKNPSYDLRVIFYKPGTERIALITDLTDTHKYKTREISGMYHTRWEGEEFFKAGKHLSDIEQFHAKNPDGVKQELYALMLLHTLTRIVEAECRIRDKTYQSDLVDTQEDPTENNSSNMPEPDYPKPINPSNHNGLQAYNFKNSMSQLGYYLQELALSDCSHKKVTLLGYLIEEIRLLPYCRREGRHYERIRKRPLQDRFASRKINRNARRKRTRKKSKVILNT